MSDRLKIGQEVLIHGYVDEIRKDTVIIRNEGGYFGTVECEVTDIEMSDTNNVLDKIMNEITMLLDFNRLNVIKIIDKYRTIYSRKRGEWLPKPEGRFIYAQCSKCRKVSDTASNYCPCCGCLMDINDFNAYIKAELRE